MSDTTEKKEGKGSSSLSLSEALLAPLNSIFEAQIHASRSFLSFFLQMGFRHKYSEAEKEVLKKNPDENKDILLYLEQEKKAKEEIDQLKRQLEELKQIDKLNPDQEKEKQQKIRKLKELNSKWSDLIYQNIEYLDPNGNERTLSISNLSLLPIKPLAIQNANFKFELKVNDKIESVTSTIRSTAKVDPKRPWFLIKDPKNIEGEFVPQRQENSTDKTIKIDVTIGSVDVPYGLHKLISSLTNTAEDNEKTKAN
jgi:hypothetical protein